MAVKRTSAGLRDELFDELDRLREGATDAKKANAVARISGAIVSTVQMEMKYHQMAGKKASNGPVSVQKTLDLQLGSVEE